MRVITAVRRHRTRRTPSGAPLPRWRVWMVALLLCALACEHKTRRAAEALPERRVPDTHVTEQHLSAAPTDAASSGDRVPKVVFLGDSISAGLHLPGDQAFPAIVQRRLAEQGAPFQLANAGVSGDTSAGGLRRVDWVLKQAPAVVVIELGGNDGLRGQPVAAIEQNLREIIARVRAKDARPLLLGLRLPPSYGAEYARAFDAIYPRLAQELEVAYVPFFMAGVAGVPDLNLEDGLHPTRAGHERLADNVAPALKQLLLELAAKKSR